MPDETKELIEVQRRVWEAANHRDVRALDVLLDPDYVLVEADSLERKSKAEVLSTAPTAVQVAPLSVEYCQVPVPLLRLVTAIPLTAPLSTSLTWPLIKVETRSPLLVV